MAIWKRLVPAVAALALLAGCGEVAPGDSADEGGGKGRQWVLRFDTSDGSADGESIAGLYLTITPETGKIAVKVINDYGDEVLQVFDV